MDDKLKEFEDSLCDHCEWCKGAGYERLLKARSRQKYWCQLCGGSGFRRTIEQELDGAGLRYSYYPLVPIDESAPWTKH